MDVIKKFEPIFGEWYVESFIGAGSFGLVYRIYRDELGERFYSALKYISIPSEKNEIEQLHLDGMDDNSISSYYTELAKSITAETRLMYKLRGSANIVGFEDSKVIPKADGVGYDVFIRMELLTGLSTKMLSKPLTKDETVKLGIDICSALVVCSQHGIIHRDIKPDNIFVSSTGDYKLGDFGIARELEKTATFMSKKGTYNYMAPEVYKGESYGAACDIYSLGIVMYRLLNNGRLPFMPPAPQVITPADKETSLVKRMNGTPMPAPCCADAELSAIILKACAYSPSDRYVSAADMRKALQNYSAGIKNAPAYQPADDSTVGARNYSAPAGGQYGQQRPATPIHKPVYANPAYNNAGQTAQQSRPVQQPVYTTPVYPNAGQTAGARQGVQQPVYTNPVYPNAGQGRPAQQQVYTNQYNYNNASRAAGQGVGQQPVYTNPVYPNAGQAVQTAQQYAAQRNVVAFPNALKGIKIICTAVIIMLIASLFSTASILLSSFNEDASAAGEAGVIIAGLAIIAALIMEIVGCVNASKDEPTFKFSLAILCIGIGLIILTTVFTSNGIVGTIGTFAGVIVEFLACFFNCTGVMKLAVRVGDTAVSVKTKQMRTVMIGFWAAYALLTVLSSVISDLTVLVIILVISVIAFIAANAIYISILNKAKKMLSR